MMASNSLSLVYVCIYMYVCVYEYVYSRWPPTLCHWYIYVYICMYMYMHMYICVYIYMYMQNIDSFIEYCLFYRAFFRKAPIILRRQSRWPPTLCHWYIYVCRYMYVCVYSG